MTLRNGEFIAMATQSTPTPDPAFLIGTATNAAQQFARVFVPVTVIRLCTVCSEAIPAARLKAQPRATKCVPCLNAAGDVPLLRRFDEQSAQGTVETLFTNDAKLEREILRQRNTVPGYRAENAGPTFHEEYFVAATQDADVTVAEPDEETEL